MKREPLLIDKFLAKSDKSLLGMPSYKRIMPLIRDNLLEAKRFVFDSQGATYFGEMIRDMPEVIAYAQEFAIPPYPKMWVELPFAPMYKAVTGMNTDEGSEDTIGFLYLGPNVYVFVGYRDAVSMSPIFYKMNHPMTVNEEKRFCEEMKISRLSLDLFYWGSPASKFTGEVAVDTKKNVWVRNEDGVFITRETVEKLDPLLYYPGDASKPHPSEKVFEPEGAILFGRGDAPRQGGDSYEVPAAYFSNDKWIKPDGEDLSSFKNINTEALRMLRANHSVDLIVKEPDLRERVFMEMFNSSAGDLRNVIALPLFLNRTQKVTYEETIKPQPTMYRAKSRVFLSHKVIKFKLNPKPLLRKIFEGEGRGWKKLHDVRGHFCTNETAKHGENVTCLVSHDWVETADPHSQAEHAWKCMRCGGHRWWRKSHSRGHAEKGIKGASYEVTR